MIDARNTQSVINELGQASLDAIGAAVRDTRADLATYRSTLPGIAARHTQRDILNWVHDQFFAHARAQFESTVQDTSVLSRFEPRVPDGSLPALPTIVESLEIEKDTGPA